MCGRYGFTKPSDLKERYELPSGNIDLKPRYNIAPNQTLPVIVNDGTNKLEMMKWGLVPSWSKDLSEGVINARAEGIEQKPYFRKPFKSQRCLVPATFFYEWQKIDKAKVPYLFKLKDDSIFSFAGLFDVVKDTEGQEITTYTIITIEPNALVGKVHNRMPVILPNDKEDIWSDNSQFNEEELLSLLTPFSSDLMESYPVFSEVNNPVIDSPDLIKPISTK